MEYKNQTENRAFQEMLQAAVTVAEWAEMVLAGRNGSFQPEQPQRWSWSAAV